MMKNNLLLDTLHAVEQVEISFEQTLRTIGDINHRYELVSTLKQSAANGQDSYEREIQAAITNRTFTKISSKKWKKKKAKPVKRFTKRRIISACSLNEPDYGAAVQPAEQTCASPSAPQMDIPYMSMQTNCQFYHIECKSNIVVPKRTYRERIERLHRAAHKKLSEQCKAFSNGCGNPETEQDENLPSCCIYCCQSCCCSCCNCCEY
ncbi:uncharacterized protein LOC111078141 [Drosophila obscura]|uniref:uncharacterized protein LOC111078141 n=1 Tax=Drosophila obscura TaxID=7282 RepID=UPI001BB12503|nr:uncharacterized protein LOC111078141 [Drosophila obscura]